MSRILLHVEGITEVSFVNEILAPHLYSLGYVSVKARLMGGVRLTRHRGGVRRWEGVRDEIVNNLIGDSELIVSTMVDYYGMMLSWPSRRISSSSGLTITQRADLIESALLEDVRGQMDRNFNSNRFVPYVMMHEFEAMLFSDCRAFGNAIGRSELSSSFQTIRNGFDNPEEIDDSPTTAPSRRIQSLVPGYHKPIMGTLAAQRIGLHTIREECSHFRGWLEHLESLL